MKKATPGERERAVKTVLNLLRGHLALLSIPLRQDAVALVKKHSITAEDLLECAVKAARYA